MRGADATLRAGRVAMVIFAAGLEIESPEPKVNS